MVSAKKAITYLNSLKRISDAALKLGMPSTDFIRYLFAYTKNARIQLGSPEKFNIHKINSFNLDKGEIFFRDNISDPATLTELIDNQYEFSKVEGSLVDAGAGIGIASKVFSFYNPENKVFCFEPVKEDIEVIKLNCPKAKVYQVALGKIKGSAEFSIHPKNFMAFKENIEGEKRIIKVLPLDDFDFGDIGVLKIDTEGSEVDILLGAKKTLRKTKEVKMETHSIKLHKESKRILKRNGFVIVKDSINSLGFGYIFAKKSPNGGV
jgi:FkbM family methyltransferase